MKKKIFVTLGSQKFQFDRLLKSIDKVCQESDEYEIFAQIGYSKYVPKNFEYRAFLDRDQFTEQLNNADIVITHGGTGAIIGAVKKGKKVIAVPRLEKYGEHVDDHQIQIIKQFENSNLLCPCYDLDNLGEVIEKARKTDFGKYESNTKTIIDSIDEFIVKEL